MDDGRAEMSRLIEPGQQGTFKLTVTAPSRPGSYQLELDMVEEGVTWFTGKGSQTLRTPCRVSGRGRVAKELKKRIGGWRGSPSEATAPTPAPGEIKSNAFMEMYCLPRDEVLAVVRDAGGEVVRVEEYDAVGDGHLACSYVVTRASAP
jgi:hypothetical protein